MSKFALREKFAAEFEKALRNAGMQRWTGTEDKPKYWRGQVDDIHQNLFLLYNVTDNINEVSADDRSMLRTVYIDGQLFTRTGYSNGEYQDLAEAIEEECNALGIDITFSLDGIDNQLDKDNPAYYCSFEASKKYLM